MASRLAAARFLLGLIVVVVLVAAAARARNAQAARAAVAEAPRAAAARPVSPTPSPMPIWVNRTPTMTLSSSEERAIVERARLEIDRVQIYDNSWRATSAFPMGDIPSNRGACTDVVVRSLRAIGLDLQELVHEDVRRDAKAYRESSGDWHIDHRRMSTLFTFFSRHAMELTTNVRDRDAFRPGDIVFISWSWMRGSPPKHVAIVSDRTGPRGLPLLIENGGPRPVESDTLGRRKVVGHFRVLSVGPR